MSQFPPLPSDKKFGAILCDPPWAFKTWGGSNVTPHRTAKDHYSTETVRQLAQIPVADVAAKDCALFMWVISSHIPQAIELGQAWGFEFKTDCFTWLKTSHKTGKPRMSMGYWSRKYTEKCFLFTRGKPKRVSAGVPELIVSPRREHSRKPDLQYSRIQRLVEGPYLEMFARQTYPGWSAWGNQTDKFDVAA